MTLGTISSGGFGKEFDIDKMMQNELTSIKIFVPEALRGCYSHNCDTGLEVNIVIEYLKNLTLPSREQIKFHWYDLNKKEHYFNTTERGTEKFVKNVPDYKKP